MQERERQQMADMIKKQYLGGEKLKKKMLKPSEKFKFNFDWEAGDDTSKDLNPLYNNTHEAQLLFGRGLRAGVDRREQKKVRPGREDAVVCMLMCLLCKRQCWHTCVCNEQPRQWRRQGQYGFRRTIVCC